MKPVRIFLIVFLALSCYGCQMLTPTACKQGDLEAKQLQLENGKSYIYVVWPWGLVGGAMAHEINVNGKILGEISRGKYFLVVLEPRETNFVAALADGKVYSNSHIAYFSCQPNQCKYLEVIVGYGFSFRELDAQKGEKIIKSSSLIKKIVLE